MAFKTVDLFGGALTAEIPSSFADVSNIRQIPDHQEVYLDSQGFSSIVVEILERVDKPDSDALKYHLEDIVEGDINATKIITTAEAHFSKLPPGTPAFTLLATAPADEKQKGRANEPDFVAIYLTLLRLVDKNTDMLLVVNVPFIKDQYDASIINLDAGQLGSLGDSARLVREKLLQTFDIKDWSLFGEE